MAKLTEVEAVWDRRRLAAATLAAVLASALLSGACAEDPAAEVEAEDPEAEVKAVSQVLDQVHAMASAADYEGYFSQYAGEFVFLGTDWWERWDRPAFTAYAKERFDTGTGWTYTLIERNVTIGPGGDVAWFDERLDNATIGESRGSGVLVREDGAWRVAQYNLTVPVPNEILRDVADQIRAFKKSAEN